MTSLNELTSFEEKIYQDLITINNIRSRYEGMEVKNVTLTELPQFKAWEKARVEKILECATQLTPEDALQLVGILERYGQVMANEQYVPLPGLSFDAKWFSIAFYLC